MPVSMNSVEELVRRTAAEVSVGDPPDRSRSLDCQVPAADRQSLPGWPGAAYLQPANALTNASANLFNDPFFGMIPVTSTEH
jgi:hypothetical protein